MSKSSTLTRQQLYDKIRESSKDAVILSEMIRLGYWQENADKPSLPKTLIEEEATLQKRFNALLARQRLIDDPEAALKMLHKARKKAALERRETTKRAHNEARYQRALNWYHTQQRDVPFLGHGTSAALQNDQSQPERLQQQGLPNFATGLELAEAMGVSINELRFLSYDRKTTQISHYQQFLISKKTGGTRRISAPMPRLKRLQYWILGNILEQLPPSEYAHGFVANRSIVTNATPHVGKSVVINMDLQDFFPTISYRRIKGLFQGFGYSEKIATVLALLCSEPERDEIDLDGETYFMATGDRHLPQGAPTSPAISNLMCRKLDKRVVGAAKALNFTYTRYADDLSFSYDEEDGKTAPVTELLWRVKRIIADEGFVVHPDKTRIMRRGQHQEVTGIVVNDKLSIDRKTLKRFRALLFQIDKDGVEGKSWGNGELFYSIAGYANYVAMVNPEKGRALKDQVSRLTAKYGRHPANHEGHAGHDAFPAPRPLGRAHLRQCAVNGEAPTEQWWQANAPDAPVKTYTPQEIAEQKRAQQQADNPSEPDASHANTDNNSERNAAEIFADYHQHQDSLQSALRRVGYWLFALMFFLFFLLWVVF